MRASGFSGLAAMLAIRLRTGPPLMQPGLASVRLSRGFPLPEARMRSLLAAAAAAVLLAGCGSALAQSGAAMVPVGASRAGTAGSRAQAAAYARHLLAELSLPEGTKPASVTMLPPLLRAHGPAGPGWAGASRVLIVPGKPLAALRRISTHAPFNEPVLYSAIPVWSSTMFQAPLPGIDAAIADLAVAAHPGGTTLVAAYAFAAWLPARSTAEHLDPASFRAVTITMRQLGPHPRTASRTFTSAAVITRFTAFLNGRIPAPESAVDGLSCPAPVTSYALRFTPRDKHGPAVTVSAGCLTAAMTVNARPQPLLWDTDGGLKTIARQLLGHQAS
jgi:hypothetical protein